MRRKNIQTRLLEDLPLTIQIILWKQREIVMKKEKEKERGRPLANKVD